MKMLINKSTLFTLFLSFILVMGCTEDKQQMKAENFDLAKRYPPNEQYPMGYSDVDLGDGIMRIPHELLGHLNYASGSITLAYIWPEFISIKALAGELRSSSIQKTIDTLQIYIFARNPDENAYESLSKAKNNKEALLKEHEESWNPSKEYADLLVSPLSGSQISRIYTPINNNVKDPLGQPLLFYCLTSLDEFYEKYSSWDDVKKNINLPFCGVTVRWSDNHSLSIRFKEKHMPDAIKIYQKVIQLHDELILKS